MNGSNISTYNSATSSIPTVNLLLYAIEMLLNLSAIVCCLLFLGLLYRILVFHQNLRILLGNMAIACIIQGTTRNMRLIQKIFVPESLNSNSNLHYCWFVVATNNASLYIVSLSLISLAVERLIATIYAKTYETTRNVFIGVGLVIFQWIFAWGAVLISEANQESKGVKGSTCASQGRMSTFVLLISLYTVLATSLTAVATFIALLYVNKRRYVTTFINRTSHSLSERYQLSENIKTTRLLYPVVTVNAICSLLGICLLIFMLVSDGQSTVAKIAIKISDNTFSLLMAGYAAIFPWLSAFGHPGLQRELKKIVHCCTTVSIAPGEPRNANGVALILNQNKERSAHFEALNNAWNT